MTFSDTQAEVENAIVKSAFPEALESIDYRLGYVEGMCNRTYVKLCSIERNTVKSYHWVTVVAVLVVAYLIGVKYPSIGASALSKVGL